MRFLLFLALAFSSVARAGILQSAVVDAAANNITNTYSLSAPYSISVPKASQVGTICWLNLTATLMAIYVDNDLSAVAPTADVQDIYVPASMTAISCLPPPITKITRTIQIRSAGATITTGKFYLFVTDRKG